MNIVVIIILAIIQRALGNNLLTIPLLTVYLFSLNKDNLPKFSFISGLLIDLVLSYPLGISSILLLLSSFEISNIKTSLKSQNVGAIFIVGIIISVQANIFWQTPQSFLRYIIQGVITVLFYLLNKNIGGIRSDGVYLKK